MTRLRWAGAAAVLLGSAALAAAFPGVRRAVRGAVREVRAATVLRERAALPPEEPPLVRLAASQVGYGPRLRKRFTSPKPFASFSVVDVPGGSVAFRGGAPVRSVPTDVLGAARTAWIGDFTPLHRFGRYRIVADNGLTSHPFAVGPDVFDAPVLAVERAFYFQRAFTAVDARYARGPWTHASDADRAPPGERGGWHDAGDLSIYNASATTALSWLLQAWRDFAPAADDTGIPESGNGVPDLLDEARWGLSWMLSVQEPSGGFRNTTCQERYGPYGTNFPEGAAPYRSGEVGSVATARAVGTLAQAAAAFRPFDGAFAAGCLSAARRGWAWLVAHPGEASDGPTCPALRQDGDVRAGREARAYAAAGLLLATGEPRFREAFDADVPAVDADPSYRRTGVLAALLYLRAGGADPVRRQDLRERLLRQADRARADGAAHPFEWAGRYFWGSIAAGFHRSNAFSARACLEDPVGRQADCEQALASVHYALGRNALHFAYVSGLPGVTHGRARAFHHWLAALRAEPFLFPGLVAGGPSASPEPADASNPYARPVPMWGYWGDPAMPRDGSTPLDARYTDNDSWSTNELDVDWQGAALYALAFARWWAGRAPVARPAVLESAPGEAPP